MNDNRASALLKRAVIIAVGSELLTPHRIDTNSLLLTTRLNALGIEVRHKLVVGDDRADIADTLQYAMGHADLVVMTGGLGPTEDDLTTGNGRGAFGAAARRSPGRSSRRFRRASRRGVSRCRPSIVVRRSFRPARS